MSSIFKWNGAAARAEVVRRAAALMDAAGRAGVEQAKALVPVDTGQTRDSIGYYFDQSTLTLTLYVGTSWAVHLEYGTVHYAAHPFMRPGLAVAASVLGGRGAARVQFP